MQVPTLHRLSIHGFVIGSLHETCGGKPCVPRSGPNFTGTSKKNTHLEPMPKPIRLQLSRKKGYNLRELSLRTNGLEAVVITRASRWGNPVRVGSGITLEAAIKAHRSALLAGKLAYTPDDVRAQLRGKNLACWCPPGSPCHGDVLMEIANQPRKKLT